MDVNDMRRLNIDKIWWVIGLFSLTMFVCMAVLSSGKILAAWHGFGADSSGLLYVGYDDYIQVYDDGVPVRQITFATDRGYCFTVDADDRVVSVFGGVVHTFSLDGAIISERADVMDTGLDLDRLREITAGDGSVYRVESIFGFKTFYKYVGLTKSVIYKTPLLDYLVVLILEICGLGLMVSLASLAFILWHKNRIHRTD